MTLKELTRVLPRNMKVKIYNGRSANLIVTGEVIDIIATYQHLDSEEVLLITQLTYNYIGIILNEF